MPEQVAALPAQCVEHVAHRLAVFGNRWRLRGRVAVAVARRVDGGEVQARRGKIGHGRLEHAPGQRRLVQEEQWGALAAFAHVHLAPAAVNVGFADR